MRSLSKEVDLSFLINREVIQIAIGTYQVIFAFDGEVTISVEGQFDYSEGTSASHWQPGSSHAAASTVGLLGARVKSARAQADGTLTLDFSNSARLAIRDLKSGHESYQITHRGETVVV